MVYGKKRRRSSGGSSSAIGLAKTLASATANAVARRLSQSAGSSRQSNSSAGGGGINTNQNDVTLQYKYKKMPRKLKRKIQRKVKTYKAMKNMDLPQRIFQFFNGEKLTWAPNTSVYTGAIIGRLDLDKEEVSVYNAINEWCSVSNIKDKLANTTVRCDSAIMRVVIRNGYPGPGLEPDHSGIVDLDIYRVVCTRDLRDDAIAATYTTADWLAMFQRRQRQSQAQDWPVGLSEGGAGISTLKIVPDKKDNQHVGSSLFDNSMFCRYFKILKVHKVQLSPGQICEFSYKQFKNKYFKIGESVQPTDETEPGLYVPQTLAFKKGFTAGFIINCNGRVHDTGSNLQTEGGTVFIERYARYSFKPMSQIGGNSLDVKTTFEP